MTIEVGDVIEHVFFFPDEDTYNTVLAKVKEFVSEKVLKTEFDTLVEIESIVGLFKKEK